MRNADNIQKDIKTAKALSIIEGVCFFVAGICAAMAGSILGYASGGLMIIMSCFSLAPVFLGGDEYFKALGSGLLEDKDADEIADFTEEKRK